MPGMPSRRNRVTTADPPIANSSISTKLEHSANTTPRNIIFIAFCFNLGRATASSYFPVTKLLIIATDDVKKAKRPNSSGL